MKRKTIGVIIPLVDQYYQRDLLNGINDMARELACDLLYFCGSQLKEEKCKEKFDNELYGLINMKGLDGFLSISGTLSNQCSTEFFQAFINKYDAKPMIHVSYEDKERHCIYVNNYDSMMKVVRHIKKDHRYKKVAYISGPMSNKESIRREAAFIDYMENHDVPNEDYRIVYGDFSKESAHAAVYELYDSGWKPDALICANDEMAIGVNEVLVKLEDPDWERIPFTGFDNIANATTFSPSFTTVDQPLYDMGRSAISSLALLMEHGMKHVTLPHSGKLIIRESCGCNNFGSIFEGYQMDVQEKDSIQDKLIAHIRSLDSLSGKSIKRAYSFHAFATTLSKELEGEGKPGSFLTYLQSRYIEPDVRAAIDEHMELIKSELMNGFDMMPSYITEIFLQFEKMRAKQVIKDARRENYHSNTIFYYSSEMISEMIGISTRDDMFAVIDKYIHTFGFDQFHICLFEEAMFIDDNQEFTYPEHLDLKFSYSKGAFNDLSRFRTEEMVPFSIRDDDEPVSYVMYPLNFQDSYFGYIICDLHATESPFLDIVKRELANTLERLYIKSELERYNQYLSELSIRDSLTELYNRRGIMGYFDTLSKECPGGKGIGILLGDINNLKEINDTYGHNEGDIAIIAMARILKEVIQGEVGRIGGDEFLCVVDTCVSTEELERMMDQVASKIDAYNEEVGKPYLLSISLGIDIWEQEKINSIDEVIQVADEMLYDQKRRYKKLKHEKLHSIDL